MVSSLLAHFWRIAGAFSLSFGFATGGRGCVLEIWYMQNSAGTKVKKCGTGGVRYLILRVITRDNLSTEPNYPTPSSPSHHSSLPSLGEEPGSRLFILQKPSFCTEQPDPVNPVNFPIQRLLPPSPPYQLLTHLLILPTPTRVPPFITLLLPHYYHLTPSL